MSRFRRPSTIHHTPLLPLLIAAALLSTGTISTQAGTVAAPANTPTPVQEIPWGITGSAGGTSDDFYGGIELLYPLWFDGDTLLFLYPEVEIADKDRQAYALGLGLRHYFEEWNAIAGVSAFWDITSSTYDNTYNGFGLSGEILTKWVDARLNWYLNSNDQNLIDSQTQNSSFSSSSTATSFGAPFAQGNQILQPSTTTPTTRPTNGSQTFERFEAAMDGLDVEAGVLVPYFSDLTGGMELRLFAGYYTYDNPFGDDIEGFKARGELRVTKWLTGDIAYYEDEELFGGNVYGGARVHFPLGKIERPVHISGGHVSPAPATTGAGKNSVAKAPVTFTQPAPSPDNIAYRLTENIIRNPRILTADSGYIENEKKRKESTTTTKETTRGNKVVLNDVVFVNNGPATDEGIAEGIEGKKKAKKKTGAERGTAENPAFQIQEGVNLAEINVNQGRNGNVFVQGGGDDYVEDVNISTSLALYGSVPAYGGYSFGGNIKPVIDGGIGAANVDSIMINSFRINNGRGTPVPGAAAPNFGIGDGIYLENVPYVTLTNNMLFDLQGNTLADGIHVRLDTGDTQYANLTNNTVNFARQHGIQIDVNNNANLEGKIINNTSTNNGNTFDDGIKINVEADAEIWIVGNTSNNNGDDGFDIDVIGDFTGEFVNNTANDNRGVGGGNGNGFEIDVANFTGWFKGNTANNNDGDGVDFDFNGDFNGHFMNNTANNNGNFDDGIDLRGTNFTGDITGNTTNDNYYNGIEMVFSGDFNGDLANNTANRNDGSATFSDGLELDANSITGNIFGNVTNDNANDGLNADSDNAFTGHVFNNEANRNGDEGIELDGDDFTGNITNNTTNENEGNGFDFDFDDVVGHFVGNTANDNGTGSGTEHGFNLDADNFTGNIAYNTANGNEDDGFNIDLDNNGNFVGNLKGNTANGNDDHGIRLETGTFGAGNFIGDVWGNTANNNEDDEGIQIIANNFTGNIDNNETNGNADGGFELSASGNFDGKIINNTANSNGDAGLLFDVLGHMDAMIKNNNANGNTQAGIRVGDAPGNNGPTSFTGTVWGNTANNNGADGITLFVDNGTWDASIDNNNANGNNGNGLFVTGVSHFTGNIVNNTTNSNTAGDGLLIEALGDMNSMIKNNTSNGNSGDGIRVGDAAGDNGPTSFTGTVWGNTANDNGDDGITLFIDDGHWNASIDNNTANSNNGQGIHVLGVIDFTGDIAHNEASGNTDGDGILIEALGAMNSQILYNTTNNNSGDGFRIGDAAGDNGPTVFNGKVRGNTANNNDDGIDIFVDGGNFNGNVKYNTANNNADEGIQFLGMNDFNGAFNSNTANENGANDAGIRVVVDNDFNGNFKYNTANDNENGVGILVVVPGNFNGDFHGNTANNNGTNSSDDGILLDIEGYFDGNISYNTANGNGADGIRLGQGNGSDGVTDFFGHIIHNTTKGNASDGQDYIVEGEFTGNIKNNTANNNSDDGFQILGIDNFEGNIKYNTASFNFDDGFRVEVDDSFIGDFSYNTGNNNIGSDGDGIKLEDVDVFTGNATGNTGNNNSGNGIQSDAGIVTGGVNGIFFHGGNTATGNGAANFNNNPAGFIGP
ncbi:MAG: right-handed parallel beta-helix repeat-containing protein [Verrucomicrobiota bacterium]